MTSTPKTDKLIEHMLEELETPSKTLSNWETKFFESVSDQWEQKHFLTDAQFEKLEEIYAEKTA